MEYNYSQNTGYPSGSGRYYLCEDGYYRFGNESAYQYRNSSTHYGWICPRCQKVYAPWITECLCYSYSDLIEKILKDEWVGEER